MIVAIETLGALEKRVLEETGGTGFTGVRRVEV